MRIDKGYPSDGILRIIEALRNKEVLISVDVEQMNSSSQQSGLPEFTCDHLLVCMTGTIQTAGFWPFLQALRTKFCRELKVILTRSASEFVSPKALMHKFDVEVFVDVFEENRDRRVPHIYLAEWASCILVAPATAATIHRIAYATCDDLVSLTISAASSSCPVIIGPSMNSRMWQNSGVRKNVATCHERGYWIIEPGLGTEVNNSWERRTPTVGAFGTQPGGLVRVLTGAYMMRGLLEEKKTEMVNRSEPSAS